MGKMSALFLGVYLFTYALSLCPHFEGTSYMLYGLATMGLLVVLMLINRFQYIAACFTPRVEYNECAVFIAGCEQSVGWQLATRCAGRDVRVYAGVEDLQSPAADWLHRHFMRNLVLVKMDPRSEDDAEAAARTVRDTLGDKVLVGAIYACHSVPKEADSLDLNDVRKGIEVDAIGAVKVALAFASLLQKHNGRYIIMADMAGRISLPPLLSYCMSQAVAIQFADIIRKKLKEYGVSVHVIEQLLHNYKKTQENVIYPETSPHDGKVIVESQADKVDHRLFLVLQSVFTALFSKSPKDHYLPTYVDYFIDKFIKYSPPCARDRVVNHYFKCINSKK